MKTVFSSFVEQKNLGLTSKEHRAIFDTVRVLPEMDLAGKSWSKKNYRKGYTSYSSISRLDEQFTVFAPLRKKLDRAVSQYVRKLGLKFDRGELKLSALWANVMPADCYHAFHIHPNSVVSGTYYVNVPSGASPLRIEDPRANLFMSCPARPIQIDFSPKAGEIILFESWMRHEVPPHSAESSRMSVSFNYDWIDR
jgi:uncharacterized protein (TIGR02466 family)